MLQKRLSLALTLSTLVIGAIFFVVLPQKASAAFNPGYIVSDFEYFNTRALSAKGIQLFLNSQSGALKNLSFTTPNGTKSAAQIIYDAAAANKMSAKVILTTLQKEQSLITNAGRATNYVLDRAMGYGCPDGASCSSEYFGFYNQVTKGARLLGDDPTWGRSSRYKVGETYAFDYSNDGVNYQNVTIANEATGLLYQYTPHRHGNEAFYNLWTQWFQVKYPDGTLLRADGEPGVWLIQNGKRYGFLSRIAFLTRGFDFKNIIVLPLQGVLAYEQGGDIQFPNLSFVKAKNGDLYFLNGVTKEPVSASVKKDFIDSGLLYEQEIIIPESEREYNALNSMPTGDALESPSKVEYPTGVLLQDISTGAIGYVKDSVMHMLHSKDILYTQFPNRTWVRVSHNEFLSFKRGAAMKLKDGTLVRSPKYGMGVYIISNGYRRPITSRDLFDGLGFKMSNVIDTDDFTMELHPVGPPFDSAH